MIDLMAAEEALRSTFGFADFRPGQRAIIEAVVSGAIDRSRLIVEPDRAKAISHALANARSGDVVVIAGKGHEPGQEIGGRILPFDDVETARTSLLRILASRRAPQ